MTTVKIYRNKRNCNKYLEVRNDGHYHNTVRQMMFWTVPMRCLNLLGDRVLHRWKAKNLKELLEDYTEVNDGYDKWILESQKKQRESACKSRRVRA